MIEADELKRRLVYSPKRGVFTWIRPPRHHEELMGEEAGSISGDYWTIQINQKKYRRSRLAYLYMIGRHPVEFIDHINGNSLDDRWVNLRPASHTENTRNRRPKKRRKMPLPMGVRIAKSGRFVARIGFDGKSISLGTFETIDQAREVYLLAREKYFGQFA